jgi:hypothetical protein
MSASMQFLDFFCNYENLLDFPGLNLSFLFVISASAHRFLTAGTEKPGLKYE